MDSTQIEFCYNDHSKYRP